MNSKTKAFSSTLVRIRKEQGFPTAHNFYSGAGGSKGLGLAFVSYWDIERGKKLPRGWRLKGIMNALGLHEYSPKAKELVRAYFTALSGTDDLLRTLSGPAPAGLDLTSRELAENAVNQALAMRKVHFTVEQWRTRSRDMATDLCMSYLNNTAGWVTVQELAAATRFKPADIRKALKALAAGELAELSGDKAKSVFTKNVIVVMPATPATAKLRTAQLEHWKTWLAGSKAIDVKRMTARMSKPNLNLYRQHMEKFVDMANVYENTEEDMNNSAVYLVDSRIYQIFPKD